ncbi:MAG: hypothetical protein NC935_05145 [Candidatus Omnitrophica bacterium]|nr:hypothetical protein [Candidatus Omnitrophota bacterium]
MKKKIIFIFLVFFLFIIGFLGGYYLINTYFPVKIKTEIEKAVKNNLNQTIKIKNLKINLIKGIIIEDIALYDEKIPFSYLKIQKAKILLFYPSLLFKTKFIESVELEDVKLFIIRYKNNTTNLPTFKKTLSSKGNFFVKNILIKNLDVEFLDQVFDFKKVFNNLQIQINLKNSLNIYFKLDWQKLIEITGLYNLKNLQLKSKIKIANLNLAEFFPYFKKIKLNNALIKNASLELKKENIYTIDGFCFLEYLETEYLLKLNNANQIYPIKYIGPLYIENFNLKIDKNTLYTISGQIKDGTVKNIPKIDSLQKITANFKLDNKNLEITSLKANLDGNPIEANVKIVDFNSPKLYLKAKLVSKISQIIQTGKKIAELSLEDQLDGNIDLLFNIKIDTLKKEFNWHINYILKDAFFLDFKKINSSGYIKNDVLFLKKVNLFYKEIPIEFSGILKNLTSFILKKQDFKPYLKIKGNINCQLLQFINAIKQIKNFSFDYKVDGELNLDFKIWGEPIKNNFNYFANYKITNANVANFSNINLYGNITNDILKLNDANFQYKNLFFKACGILENFSSPTIALTIESQLLNFYLKSFYLKNSLNIKELFITAPNSKIVVEGKFLPKEFLEIKGFGIISTNDLLKILKTLDFKSSILENSSLDGLFDISFITKGKPTIDELEIKMSAYSQNLNVYNLNFFDTKIQLYKEKENLIISPIVTYIADGALELKTKLNIKTNKTIINLLLNDVDLSKIRAQLNLKNKRLEGKVSFEGYFENQNFKNLSTLTGHGKIAIKNGNIWEISLLKGLGEFLFIPDFDEIKFTEGKSDLIFKENNIIFENLNLKALQMDLEGGGKLSLDGNIHFIVFPHFNPNLISASEGLKKITTHLLGKAGLLIQIEGTLQKPIYKKRFLFLSPKVLEDVKNFFRGLLN